MAKRLQRDDIDKCMDHGIDLSSRTIFLMEEIAEYSVEPAIKALHILDRTPGDITIKISTIGGDWYAGMALYDTVTACENPIRMIGMGSVMSMGGIILQSADERLLTKHASVLVHYGSDWCGGHVKDVERRVLENKRTGVEMEDIFLPRIREKVPGFSREDFRQKFAFDVFMSAKEAVDFGLADEILA